jgi:hypothetical protein
MFGKLTWQAAEMFIKAKHAGVIVFSSIFIGIVMASTVVGYGLYLRWKEDALSVSYRNTIYKLSADMFRKDIEIFNIRLNIQKTGIFQDMPVLEAKVKNNSPKPIRSLMLEVLFFRANGYVVYRDWVYPLEEQLFSGSPFFSGIAQNDHTLMPGETMTFRHFLSGCPSEITSSFFSRSGFVKDESKRKVKMDLTVAGVAVS